MTKNTYRKKALPHLLRDFGGHCAYCLDPGEFRHPSYDTHVEHFDCKLKPRLKHQYKNLMLACSTCNLVKWEKPIRNPFDHEQRLLKCTEENEFLADIKEDEKGHWLPQTAAGRYHLQSIGLTEPCHTRKRATRRQFADELLKTCQTAIHYKSANPEEVHDRLMSITKTLLDQLENFPPLVTERGVMKIRDWLCSKGVPVELFDSHPATD